MNKVFYYHDAPAKEPVIFDQIFAEKVGGGIVENADFDRLPGLAVSADGKVIKAAKLYAAADSGDSTVTVEKNSGVAANEYLAYGKKAVQVTAVDKSEAEYDVLTLSMGVDMAKGDVLYQAQGASASSAKVKYTPKYVLGTFLPANCGDELAKLVNGANVRKETALFSAEVAAEMPGITLI